MAFQNQSDQTVFPPNPVAANLVAAGPTSGAATTPTFRALVTADLPAGTGTATSVGLTVPAELAVSGSPVTAAGTLAVTWATEAANKVFAGPVSGGVVAPAFRSLVAGDIIAAESASVNLATQGAAVGATSLVASPNGLYRVSYYLVVTRAASSSSAVQLSVTGFDSIVGVITQSSANVTGNVPGNSFASGSFVVFALPGAALAFSTSYSSVGATAMQYALRLAVEQVQ
jgi:hypothetical protein